MCKTFYTPPSRYGCYAIVPSASSSPRTDPRVADRRQPVGHVDARVRVLRRALLFGNAWSDLLEDYNVFCGRIGILVLITIALAPFVCARIRGLLPRPGMRF